MRILNKYFQQEESFYSNNFKKTDDEENGNKETITNESSNKTSGETKKNSHFYKNIEGKSIDNIFKSKLTKDNLFQNLISKGLTLEKKQNVEKIKESFLVRKPLNFSCYKKIMSEKKKFVVDENLQMNKVKSILQNLQLKEKIKMKKPEANQ